MATDMIARMMALDAAANGADPSNYYTKEEVNAALAGKISMRDMLGYGTVIPASTAENPQDLNHYASMGVFTIETSAAAATIDNAPVAFPGRLFVLAGAAAGTNIQIYITGENLYIRRRTTALEWKPWVSMI